MPSTSPPKRHLFWLWAILLERCPRCRRGKMFRGQITMNETCSYCGLRFGREEGYYTGAMYVSYFESVAVLAVIGTLLWWLGRNFLSLWMGMLITTAIFLLFVPMIFRYSRVMWLYIDWAINPDTHSNEPQQD